MEDKSTGFVVLMTEPNTLWTVGFYKPDGGWEPVADYDKREDALNRAAALNGSDTDRIAALERENAELRDAVADRRFEEKWGAQEMRDAVRRSVARAFSKNGKKTQSGHVLHEFWVELSDLAQVRALKSMSYDDWLKSVFARRDRETLEKALAEIERLPRIEAGGAEWVEIVRVRMAFKEYRAVLDSPEERKEVPCGVALFNAADGRPDGFCMESRPCRTHEEAPDA